jgi:hypothetical protein
MPIRFTCNKCGKSFTVADHNAGKKARCPCGASLRVPQLVSLSGNVDAGAPKAISKNPSQLKPSDAGAKKHSTVFRASAERSKNPVAPSSPNPPRKQPPPLMPHTLPWKRGKDYLVGTGELIEEILSDKLGTKVRVLAFESGLSPSLSPLRSAGRVAISLLLMPLFLPLAMLLVVPSWIYFTYLTVRDWKSAEQFGVNKFRMIGLLLLSYGFGGLSGLFMALQIMGALIRPSSIILARTPDLYVLAYLSPWRLLILKFSRIATFPLDAASLKVVSEGRSKMVLTLHTPDTEESIETRSQCITSGLSPTDLFINRRLLLTGVYSDVEIEESPKSYVVAFFLIILFGLLGLDKFYLGYYRLGIIKLLTLGGGFGLGPICV